MNVRICVKPYNPTKKQATKLVPWLSPKGGMLTGNSSALVSFKQLIWDLAPILTPEGVLNLEPLGAQAFEN